MKKTIVLLTVILGTLGCSSDSTSIDIPKSFLEKYDGWIWEEPWTDNRYKGFEKEKKDHYTYYVKSEHGCHEKVYVPIKFRDTNYSLLILDDDGTVLNTLTVTSGDRLKVESSVDGQPKVYYLKRAPLPFICEF